MHCFEFRRRLLVDPGVHDDAIRRHIRECDSCSCWASGSSRFEHLLRQAIHVEVPENLAPRILLRHAFNHPRRENVRRSTFALAASIFITALLGGVLLWPEPKSTLENDVFVHIDETSYALNSTTILDDSTIAGVFGWFGANVSPDLGDVSFANVCTFRGERVAHVVLQGSSSPVTVIIMPGEKLNQSRHINTGKHGGLLLPYAGGSMAIVSEHGERLDELENRLRNAVRWPESLLDRNTINS